MNKTKLNVTFSPSAAGLLKSALEGTGEKVIFLEDHLNIGPIAPYDTLNRMLFFESMYNNTKYASDYRTIVENDHRFWRAISDEDTEPVIWFTRRSSAEYCGFLELLSRSKEPGNIKIIDLTEGVGMLNNDIPERFIPVNIAECSPEILSSKKNTFKTLTQYDISYYLNRWKKLKNENSMIRIIKRGQLCSASDNVFDAAILANINENSVNASDIITNTLENLNEEYHQVDDAYLYVRLLNIIKR